MADCECTGRLWTKGWTPELARMLELVAFYRGEGCCSRCALGFALAEVEREAKRPFPKPESCDPCRATALACYPRRPHGARR